MPQLYIDMDGVLADFDQHYMNMFGRTPPKYNTFDKDGHDINWKQIALSRDFYLGIPPMKDMRTLWGYVYKFDPVIITGIPSSIPEARDNKRAWIDKYLGRYVDVICCRSKEKCLHAKPGDTLVDDWEKYKHLWVQAGGIWITHVYADRTIEQLQQQGWCS